MATIAFIGLGNMGGPMAANLVKAGHKVVAFDLVEASRNQARHDGAAIADSAGSAVKGAETVQVVLLPSKTQDPQVTRTVPRPEALAPRPVKVMF